MSQPETLTARKTLISNEPGDVLQDISTCYITTAAHFFTSVHMLAINEQLNTLKLRLQIQ